MSKVWYDIIPNSRQKSFYGKAKVCTINNVCYLKSYDTIVCTLDKDGFHRTWGGWSATTSRHVDAFRRGICGLPSISKAEWCKLPVEYLTAEGYRLERGA